MEEILITSQEFEERLRSDPRVSDEYVNMVELPYAFSSGSKFLRKHVLKKSSFVAESRIASDWFQFSQLIERVEVNKERLKIIYDENKESHPPLMART